MEKAGPRQWATCQKARHMQWQGRGRIQGKALHSSVPPLYPPLTHFTCMFSWASNVIQSYANQLGANICCNHASTILHEPIHPPQANCMCQQGHPGHLCSESGTALQPQGPLRNQTSQMEGLSSKTHETTGFIFPLGSGERRLHEYNAQPGGYLLTWEAGNPCQNPHTSSL